MEEKKRNCNQGLHEGCTILEVQGSTMVAACGVCKKTFTMSGIDWSKGKIHGGIPAQLEDDGTIKISCDHTSIRSDD